MTNNNKKLASIIKKPLLMGLIMLMPLGGLTACSQVDDTLKMDRPARLEKQDFRDSLESRVGEFESDKRMSAIPSLQPYIAQAAEPDRAMPLVSISVNQSVPVRDVFFELAQQANYDIELDPRIMGAVIFTARSRPFDQVVERLSNVAGLRYSFKDDVLRVELDTPYNQGYKIDYLSYIRSSNSNINSEVTIASGGSDAARTGSGFSAKSESVADFWGEMEANMAQILAGTSSAMITDYDPQITALERPANLQPVGGDAGVKGVSPPDAILQITSLPQSDLVRSTAIKNEDGEIPYMPVSTFVVNRQAGIVNVFAPEKTQKDVDKYLRILRRSVTAQVLIEAKILEVSLNDAFSMGVDWRALNVFSSEFGLNYFSSGGKALLDTMLTDGVGSIDDLPAGAASGASSFVMGYAGNDVQTLIRAISEFGTVRALASPRMTVINNQTAVLSVATNRVFFDVDIDVTVDEGVTQTDVNSEIRNIPEGVLVNVQPSIDLENNTISLALRPTITRVVSEVLDPAIQFITANNDITGVENAIPELNVQEIDSVILVRSGQPIVMGGLLQDQVVSSETGLPILSEFPLIGSLFRQHTDEVKKTELIIFLKATIIDQPSKTIHRTDRELYNRFSGDRRPLKL